MRPLLFAFFPLIMLTADLPVMEIKPPPIQEQELDIVINLTDPEFSHGVIKTDKGGVITGKDLRIQARTIEYADRIENGIAVKRVIAEGDLMMEYGGQAFVGRRLEFDFLSRRGSLWEGKTFLDMWFLGGERIDLCEDGSYYIYNAYVTTSESQEGSWEISTSRVKISNNHLLSAKNVRFNFFKVPLFWIPSLKTDLKWLKEPPIRYKIRWDRKLGPRITMRYKVYDSGNFRAFARLDYRLKRGPGAALETEYRSPDGFTLFRTKSYGAYDKEIADEHGRRRYRLQGVYKTSSRDDRTRAYLSYDKFSDPKMPQDFKSEDFDVNTQKRSILTAYHEEDNAFINLNVQPRINPFQTLNQQIPLLDIGIRPIGVGPTGIISENRVSAGYLDYIFASDLQNLLASKHAARLETNNRLYRPFVLPGCTITPKVGLVGIFYNNNMSGDAVGQFLWTYGGDIQSFIARSYTHLHHRIEPYIRYEGYSRPKAAPDSHYIFSIEDGYTHLNQIRVGARQLFSFPPRHLFTPLITADLYSYAFFKADSTQQAFPKLYADLALYEPYFTLAGTLIWNVQEHVMDRTNVRAEVTVNSHVAFAAEYRHRSAFDWRKADHENFVVDVARELRDLLSSPLSDKRNTALTRLKLRLTPRLTCYLESHHGWGRSSEPVYNEFKLDFNLLIASGWRLHASIERIPGDWRKTISFNLKEY